MFLTQDYFCCSVFNFIQSEGLTLAKDSLKDHASLYYCLGLTESRVHCIISRFKATMSTKYRSWRPIMQVEPFPGSEGQPRTNQTEMIDHII